MGAEIIAFVAGAGVGIAALWAYQEFVLTPTIRAITQARVYQAPAYVATRPGLTRQIRYAPEQRVVTAPRFIPGRLRPKYQHGF